MTVRWALALLPFFCAQSLFCQEAFTVVVGSYQSQAFAQAQTRVLAGRGLALDLVRVEVKGREVYRLTYGYFTALAAADSARAALAARYRLDGWVWRIPTAQPTVAPTPPVPVPNVRDTLTLVRHDTVVVQRRDTVFVLYLPGTAETDTLEYLAPNGEVVQKVPVPHDEGRFPSVAVPENEGLLLAVIDSLDHRLRVSVDLYVDAYYAGQNRQALPDGTRELATPGYRNEQFGINTAQISARLSGERFRGLVTLHTGGVREQGWDPVTPNGLLQQANAGVRLANTLWVDAGLFMTHIGGEAIFPRDNWISSLALVTYYEPFLQAGVKLTWDATPKLQLQLHGLNGYNTFEDYNRSLSGGWLVTWLATDWLTLYTSGIVGNEQPTDSAEVLRTYTNTVAVVTPTRWLSFKAQYDYGAEAATPTRGLRTVRAGQAQAKVQFTPQWGLALRGEFYHDPAGMLSPQVRGWGGTAQLEYKPTPTSFLRLEGRHLQLDDPTFATPDPQAPLRRSRLDWQFGIGVWL